jgi:dolichol-phosphate mannosyltransferase
MNYPCPNYVREPPITSDRPSARVRSANAPRSRSGRDRNAAAGERSDTGPVERTLRRLSIVVPLYDEERSVHPLCGRLRASLAAIGVPYEVVAVDDGSRDGTRERLREQLASFPQLRIVCLSRNFGLQGAVAAGLAHTQGDVVVLMDGDLQDPPELIARMLEAWRRGADVVYATKKTRKERGLRRIGFAFFHLIYERLANIKMPPASGNFSLIDRRVLDEINRLPEHNRFLPGLRSWVGFRQVEIEFDREDRQAGAPSMTMSKLFRLAVDGIVGFSHVPIRFITILGLLSCTLGVGFIGWVLVERFVTHTAILGWPSLMIAVSFLGGVQLLGIGVLGEYMLRIFDEVRARPNYIVERVVENDEPPA